MDNESTAGQEEKSYNCDHGEEQRRRFGPSVRSADGCHQLAANRDYCFKNPRRALIDACPNLELLLLLKRCSLAPSLAPFGRYATWQDRKVEEFQERFLQRLKHVLSLLNWL